MMNQSHHSTDGSRGVEVICQNIHQAGFSLSQPEETTNVCLFSCDGMETNAGSLLLFVSDAMKFILEQEAAKCERRKILYLLT